MKIDPEAALEEVLRQASAGTKALTERLARGGDVYSTLTDTVRILGRVTDALEIGLALSPEHTVMDTLMKGAVGEMVQAIAAIKKMDRQRAADKAAAEGAKAPKVVKSTERVTLH